MAGIFMSILEKLDFSGKQISFTLNSRDSFKTPFGGVITILTRLAILAFFLYGIKDVYDQKNTITSKTYYKDMSRDQTIISLTEETFDIAIGFQYLNNETNPQVLQNLDRYVDVLSQTLFGYFDSETGNFN